jgi:hypothetical protein
MESELLSPVIAQIHSPSLDFLKAEFSIWGSWEGNIETETDRQTETVGGQHASNAIGQNMLARKNITAFKRDTYSNPKKGNTCILHRFPGNIFITVLNIIMAGRV